MKTYAILLTNKPVQCQYCPYGTTDHRGVDFCPTLQREVDYLSVPDDCPIIEIDIKEGEK